MLNASALIKKTSKTTSLPEFGGQKLFGTDDSEKEQETLTFALDQYNKLLQEERICCKGILSIANWNCVDNVAVVAVKKGSSLQKFGYQSRDGIFLNPEETLFLIDQGILELVHDGLPISLHEAYMLLVPLLPSYEYYEVYAYLCRLGYIVTRYKKRNTFVEGGMEDEKESKWGKGLGSPMKEENDKEKTDEESLEPMASGYVKNLWLGNPGEIPCLRPSEATSTASVLSKLQIMELFKLKDISCSNNEPLQWKIDFDVYLSLRSKKEDLWTPRFRIVVCKYSDAPPTLYEMGCLTNESNGVNLKLAVVNDGTISFYGMFGVDIPSILTVG